MSDGLLLVAQQNHVVMWFFHSRLRAFFPCVHMFSPSFPLNCPRSFFPQFFPDLLEPLLVSPPARAGHGGLPGGGTWAAHGAAPDRFGGRAEPGEGALPGVPQGEDVMEMEMGRWDDLIAFFHVMDPFLGI